MLSYAKKPVFKKWWVELKIIYEFLRVIQLVCKEKDEESCLQNIKGLFLECRDMLLLLLY